MADVTIIDTLWSLVEINGEPAAMGARQRPVAMMLTSGDEPRVQGFSGCNTFVGSSVLDGDSISIGPLPMTMMACPEGMALEQAFHKAMGLVAGYTIENGVLVLISAAGDDSLRFISDPE